MVPTVYIVDDTISVCRALRRLLESAGLKTVTFTSPRAFLDMPRLGPMSCLILDIRMPEMNGFALHEHLRAEKTNIPTIFITAHDDPESRAQAEEAGAVAYLTKPFDDELLLDAIRRAFAKARRSLRTSVL